MAVAVTSVARDADRFSSRMAGGYMIDDRTIERLVKLDPGAVPQDPSDDAGQTFQAFRAYRDSSPRTEKQAVRGNAAPFRRNVGNFCAISHSALRTALRGDDHRLALRPTWAGFLAHARILAEIR